MESKGGGGGIYGNANLNKIEGLMSKIRLMLPKYLCLARHVLLKLCKPVMFLSMRPPIWWSSLTAPVSILKCEYVHHHHHHCRCHHAVCLKTGSQPFPQRVLHTVRSIASSFNLQYPLFSLRSSSSCLLLITCLLVTSILHSIFVSLTYFRRLFLCNKWPNQLAILLFTVCRIFLYVLTLCKV